MIKKYSGQNQNMYGNTLNITPLNKKLDNTNILIIVFSLILILIICLFSFIIFIRIRYKFKMKGIFNKDFRHSIIDYYIYYMETLSLIDLAILPGETPLQYSLRVDSYLNFGSINNFKDITKIFLISRYSNNSLSLSDRNTVASFNLILQAKFKNSVNRFKFIILKYFLGKI